MPSSVTRPIAVASSSHLAAIARTSARRSGFATTSIRSWDSESRISYGVIPGSRVGTSARSISTPTPPRGAHVLDRHDVAGGDELEARLEQQLFGEGIADLDLWAALLAGVRQLLRRERRAVDAIAAGARPHAQQHVADTVSAGADQVPLLEQ